MCVCVCARVTRPLVRRRRSRGVGVAAVRSQQRQAVRACSVYCALCVGVCVCVCVRSCCACVCVRATSAFVISNVKKMRKTHQKVCTAREARGTHAHLGMDGGATAHVCQEGYRACSVHCALCTVRGRVRVCLRSCCACVCVRATSAFVISNVKKMRKNHQKVCTAREARTPRDGRRRHCARLSRRVSRLRTDL